HVVTRALFKKTKTLTLQHTARHQIHQWIIEGIFDRLHTLLPYNNIKHSTIRILMKKDNFVIYGVNTITLCYHLMWRSPFPGVCIIFPLLGKEFLVTPVFIRSFYFNFFIGLYIHIDIRTLDIYPKQHLCLHTVTLSRNNHLPFIDLQLLLERRAFKRIRIKL